MLLKKLGDPHDSLRFVHVAGTNGKGSTSAFVSSVMTQAGYRTGLFTSPFVIEVNERIRINGQSISDHDLAVGVEFAQAAAESMNERPTEFELMTAVAFSYFAQQKCDLVICEAGVGGRYDATNVIGRPEVCVITPINMDHQDVLGETLEDIAWEKAGIIKDGSSVVSWPQEAGVREVLEQAAYDKGTSVVYPDFAELKIEDVDLSGQIFSYKEYESLRIGFMAEYQARNAALAIEAIKALRKDPWTIPDAALYEGLAAAAWPGRFEIVAEDPLIIVDGAHNRQAVRSLASTLIRSFPDVRPIFIVGFLENKDFSSMLEEVVGIAGAFVIIEPPSSRALSARKLTTALSAVWHGSTRVAQSFEEALEVARDLAGENGVVCSFGSIYSVAPLCQVIRAAQA